MHVKVRRYAPGLQGFTLIEVLVVVAIISVLCALLLPQLARARKQARNVLCQANLSEWGKIWAMYCQVNNDSFNNGVVEDASWHRGEWITCLRSQYYTKMEILRCPLATTRLAGETHGGPFNTYYMPVGGSSTDTGGEEPSYGMNDWVSNPPPGVTEIQDRPTVNNWRRASQVKYPNRVPVFADCMWRGGGPFDKGERGAPPRCDGAWSGASAEMEHFCINRHDGYVNHLFVDWSVRRVGLKELWKLKWHRNFNTAGRWTRAGGCPPDSWPAWMQRFPDY
ncbi:MAG: type II secretion system protein [Phycisphaerae bacterium]|nr:type II secretion system protein [Phycisphaerae bacterium]